MNNTIYNKTAMKKSTARKLFTTLLFVFPAALLFFTFFDLPIIKSFFYSLFKWNGFNAVRAEDFVGLKNYAKILTDKTAQAALLNTLKYTVVVGIMENVIGLALALLVDSKMFCKNFVRVLVFIPCLLSSVVVSFTWMKIYDPYNGVLNVVLKAIGLAGQNWLGNPNLAMFSIMFTAIWQWSGYYMVIYLAGLQSIDSNLIEASMLDGAGYWSRFKNVVFPMLAPSFTVAIVLATINGFKVFDAVYMMTQGGPGYSTEVIMSQIYYQAYMYNNTGYSCALSVVLFVIIMIISLFQLKFLNKREDVQ